MLHINVRDIINLLSTYLRIKNIISIWFTIQLIHMDDLNVSHGTTLTRVYVLKL